MPAPHAPPPTLLVVFNRPAVVVRMLAALAESQPPVLYVAADGARAGNPTDAVQCDEVRTLIHQGITWPCRVQTLFHETNVGLPRAMITALDWFFAHETHGAILEDDCVPGPDFLPFAGAMLDRWADDPRIMHVSGTTAATTHRSASADNGAYRFAQSGTVWGWATWRRAWQHFDPSLAEWPVHRAAFLRDRNPLRRALAAKFASAYAGRKWTWARAWYWSVAKRQGLAIIPRVNLVHNIGDGDDATHRHGPRHPLRRATERLDWPLIHPLQVAPDIEAERWLARYHRGSWRRQLSDAWYSLRDRWT